MTDRPAGPAPRGLSRVLGLAFGVAVVIGGMIGSGIMRAPGVVAQGIASPPFILLAWVAGGAVTMLAAMPVVEAGASVPMAGGPFPIAERAFGPTVGFLTGWVNWLAWVGASAFVAVVFGEYVHRLGFAGGLSAGAIGCGLIAAVAVVNWLGTKVSGASQSLGSALKGAAFLLLAAVLFLSPRAPASAAATHAAAIGAASGSALVMAVRVIFQTYAGWDAAIYFSEEVTRPDRNVSRSIFGGIAMVAVLYVLMNAAVLHVLTPAAIAGSALAVGDAAKVSLGVAGDLAITAIGAMSLAAIANLIVMIASRVTWRMARDGALPPALGAVAKGGAPRRSVTLIAVVAMLFTATGSYESLVRISQPWITFSILMVCLSAIRLRIAEPDLERPWKMPLFPWIAIAAVLAQAGLIALMVWDDPMSGLLSALLAIAPLPIYLVFAGRWRSAAQQAFSQPPKGEAAHG
ncbi:MAG: APC family permease [Caulobacteraceae bacterium]